MTETLRTMLPIASERFTGSVTPLSRRSVLNCMKSVWWPSIYATNSSALCFLEKLSGSSPSGRSSTLMFIPSASSMSVPLMAAWMPASSPSYNSTTFAVKRCNMRIWYTLRAVPELATTFSMPHWCIAITSVYPSTIYTQSSFTIARLAWYSP